MNRFENWLTTKQGIQCNDFKSIKEQKYLTNRLFWAFSAGEEIPPEIIIDEKIEQLNKTIEWYESKLKMYRTKNRELTAKLKQLVL